eukprot:Skav235251  [mRNA]  locus=scaffold3995:354493:355562:+ [translate_table: standard]
MLRSTWHYLRASKLSPALRLAATLDRTAVEAFAALEHKNWEKAMPSAVHAYDKGFGPLTRQCIPPLLDAVGCKAGSQLLDVATGPGFAAEAAAKIGASVTAMDFSKNMLHLAEKRLKETQVKLVEADAAAMPFEANSFDAVVCSFGVLHLPVPEDFFAEAWRILRPGGRLGFTVWAATPSTEAMALVHEAVQLHGNPHVPLPEGPPFFRFADVDDTMATLEAAGFAAVECKQVPMTWDLMDSAEAFVTFRDGTGRTAALLAGQSQDQLKAIQEHIISATEAKRLGPGQMCRFQMPCVLTVAQKP